MKIGLLSDVHGNLEAMKKVAKEDCDFFICSGDVAPAIRLTRSPEASYSIKDVEGKEKGLHKKMWFLFLPKDFFDKREEWKEYMLTKGEILWNVFSRELENKKITSELRKVTDELWKPFDKEVFSIKGNVHDIIPDKVNKLNKITTYDIFSLGGMNGGFSPDFSLQHTENTIEKQIKIKKDLDMFVTHSPPYKTLDKANFLNNERVFNYDEKEFQTQPDWPYLEKAMVDSGHLEDQSFLFPDQRKNIVSDKLEKLDEKDSKEVYLEANKLYKENEKLGYERVGSKTLRNCLDKYQPKYWVCGHVHEARGEKKVGNTRVINPGSLFSGEYAVLDTNTGEVEFEQI